MDDLSAGLIRRPAKRDACPAGAALVGEQSRVFLVPTPFQHLELKSAMWEIYGLKWYKATDESDEFKRSGNGRGWICGFTQFMTQLPQELMEFRGSPVLDKLSPCWGQHLWEGHDEEKRGDWERQESIVIPFSRASHGVGAVIDGLSLNMSIHCASLCSDGLQKRTAPFELGMSFRRC